MDASIIDAPSSTTQGRTPCRCTYLRAFGVDAESGLAHSLATTAANAADVTQASCCCMVTRRRHGATPPGEQGLDVAWQVAMKPSSRLLDRDGAEAAAEKRKASVRAKVEPGVRYPGTGEEHAAHRVGSGSRICFGRYATG